MSNQLLYTFLCSTKVCETRHGKVVPLDGIRLVAALAHKYGIPVTWVVDNESVEAAKDIINQGHIEYNDDLVLMIEPFSVLKEVTAPSKAEELVILRQRLPEFIRLEQSKIKRLFPWTEARIIGASQKSSVLIQVLEEMDCIGLWGYRWEDSEADSIADGGCPWSFFFASRNHHNIPSPYSGKLVAIQDTSIDLNSVFYTGNSHIFSSVPSYLRRSGLCKDDNSDYAKSLLDEYLINLPWNRFLIFTQYQPACDMEYDSYEVYDKGIIASTARIMEVFFQEVVSNPQIDPMTLSQAVRIYAHEFDRTESSYMIFDSISSSQADIDFFVPPKPKSKPPYPLTFFYYDSECLMIFREGQMTPVEVRNYIQPPFESRYNIEKEIPFISAFRPSRDRDKLIMEFEIESVKQMPFGLVIWDDHSMFNLVSTNARSVKWIGTHLLFVRVDLREGMNLIEISLAI